MYIYFNRNGALSNYDPNPTIRQGNVNVDHVYAYFDGIDTSVYSAELAIERPDGTTSPYRGLTPIDFTQNGHSYSGYHFLFDDPWLTAVYGQAKLTIRLYDSDSNIVCSGMVKFPIEQTVYDEFPDITVDQYNDLITRINRVTGVVYNLTNEVVDSRERIVELVTNVNALYTLNLSYEGDYETLGFCLAHISGSENECITLVLREGILLFSREDPYETILMTGTNDQDVASVALTIAGTTLKVKINRRSGESVESTLNLSSTFIPLSTKGAANGVAPLDANSKIPSQYIPNSYEDVYLLFGTSTYLPEGPFPSGGVSERNVFIAVRFPRTLPSGYYFYKLYCNNGTASTWTDTGVVVSENQLFIVQNTNLTYRANVFSETTPHDQFIDILIALNPALGLGYTHTTAFYGDEGKANSDKLAALTITGLEGVISWADGGVVKPIKGLDTRITTLENMPQNYYYGIINGDFETNFEPALIRVDTIPNIRSGGVAYLRIVAKDWESLTTADWQIRNAGISGSLALNTTFAYITDDYTWNLSNSITNPILFTYDNNDDVYIRIYTESATLPHSNRLVLFDADESTPTIVFQSEMELTRKVDLQGHHYWEYSGRYGDAQSQLPTHTTIGFATDETSESIALIGTLISFNHTVTESDELLYVYATTNVNHIGFKGTAVGVSKRQGGTQIDFTSLKTDPQNGDYIAFPTIFDSAYQYYVNIQYDAATQGSPDVGTSHDDYSKTAIEYGSKTLNVSKEITIATSDWILDNNTHTYFAQKTIVGVSLTTSDLIMPSPKTRTDSDNWVAAEIFVSATTGTESEMITFEAKTLPTASIVVDIAFLLARGI